MGIGLIYLFGSYLVIAYIINKKMLPAKLAMHSTIRTLIQQLLIILSGLGLPIDGSGGDVEKYKLIAYSDLRYDQIIDAAFGGSRGWPMILNMFANNISI